MNSIGSIICAYRKHRNLSQKELAAALNQSGLAATNQVISKWENDTAKPSIEVLFGICQILGIRNFYEEMYGADPLDKLSELNEAGKEKALDYIQLLIDSGKYKKQPEVQILTFPHRQIKLYDLPVSAGTGEFLDSEHYTLLDAETTIPEGTDFAVRIHGDSMEPMFANQQIIWIHQQEQLEDGDIGIFYLDGNAYCKKLQDNRNGVFLISLNQVYKPIPITSSSTLKIFGKVLG